MQPEPAKVKYEDLERELLECRNKVTAEMTEYMEEVVGKKLFDLNRHISKTEAQIEQSHPVCINIIFSWCVC